MYCVKLLTFFERQRFEYAVGQQVHDGIDRGVEALFCEIVLQYEFESDEVRYAHQRVRRCYDIYIFKLRAVAHEPRGVAARKVDIVFLENLFVYRKAAPNYIIKQRKAIFGAKSIDLRVFNSD